MDVRNEVLEHFKRSDRDRERQLCSEDLELLKKWNFDKNLTERYDNHLTVQGWNDLKYMAIDYQRTFQNVLETRYSKEKFRFGFTDTQRAEASYKAFTEGLFGEGAESIIDAKPETNSSILLRPYENCPEWNKHSDDSKDKNSEVFKFKQSEIYKRTAEEISARLGFKYTLNDKQIDNLWDMCRYDQAWYIQDESPWCVSFTPEHVNVLEYLEDLKYYYKASYGNKLNENVMCSAVQDMIRNLQSDSANPKVTAYFTHAAAMQLILTSLGYAKDSENLRADNYQQMKYRKFRTSVLSPFASNLVAVKYQCPNDPEFNKVQFFLNERPIEFSWCNIGLCDLSRVIEMYKKFLDADCRDMFCGGNSGSTFKISFIVVLVTGIFTYLF